MKGIVIYRSKYGSAKKYAHWIGKETGFVIKEVTEVRTPDLVAADTVVFGSGVYASGIAGISFVRNNARKLYGKRVFVYACGASPYDERNVEALKAKVFTGELSPIPFFYCRGAWDLGKMTFMDRQLCRMLQKAVAKKDPSEMEVWEKALVDIGDESIDWTDRKYLEPLLEAIGR